MEEMSSTLRRIAEFPLVEGDSQPIIEKEKIDRESRGSYLYQDNNLFDKPLVIRGTNKQFVPSSDMITLDTPSDYQLKKLIEVCKEADDSLDIVTVHNISEMEIVSVSESFLIFKYQKDQESESKVFVMEVPLDKESIAFKRFSSLLRIPYSFSRRNPGFINKMNFDYWQKTIALASDKKIPVDLIFQKEPYHISTESGESIDAYLIVNIKKARQTRGKESEVIESHLMERVPLFSKIVKNVSDQITDKFPEIKPSLQSYSLGYTGENKGRHFSRIVFDSPETSFDVDDELYSMAVSIETDFIGDNKGGDSEVYISFGLLREVCSNGLVIPWNAEQKEEIKNVFLTNYLSEKGITEDSDNYDAIKMEAEVQFSVLYSKEGFKIPTVVANSMIGTSGFDKIFEMFKNSIDFMKEAIQDLNVKFDEVSEKEFVETAMEVSHDLDMSPEVIKYFLLEYLAGTFEGQKQVFNTPLDIMNFLTYICRAYSSSVQFDIERKAYMFSMALATILIHKNKAEKSSYDRMIQKINPDLL